MLILSSALAAMYNANASDQQERASALQLEPVKFVYLNFPPHTYTVKGVPTGHFLDLTRMVLEDTGHKFEIMELPASRLYNRLESGNVHIFLGPPSGAGPKKGSVIIGSLPIGRVSVSLYWLPTTKPIMFDGLINTSVITIKGFVYANRLGELRQRKTVRILETPSHKAAAAMLHAGRAPYVMDYEKPFELALQKMQKTGVTSTQVYSFPVVFYVSKAAENPTKLLQMLEKSLARVLASEEFKTLEN